MPFDNYQSQYTGYSLPPNQRGATASPITNPNQGLRNVTKGRLGGLTFQVNPTNITYGGGTEWAEIRSAGMFEPVKQVGSMKPNTISFELYVNEWIYGKKVVAQTFINTLAGMATSDKPYLLVLGANYSKTVVIDSYDVTVESYNPDLTIREARINLTLTSIGID